MSVERGKLVSGGRIQVPAEFRRALGIKDGDAVVMELSDGVVLIRPYRDVIKRIQDRFRKYAPKSGYASDELIAERRAEAARE